MDMSNQEYNAYVMQKAEKSPIVKNTLLAFLIGGAICTLGQAIYSLAAAQGLPQTDASLVTTISLIGLCSSGANILIYSTGRGSPVGTPVAPSIKLTASPTALNTFRPHMDVEITDVTSGEATLEEGGMRLFQALVDTANGELTASERGRNREVAFPLLMKPL